MVGAAVDIVGVPQRVFVRFEATRWIGRESYFYSYFRRLSEAAENPGFFFGG